jgi:hypothetical protein
MKHSANPYQRQDRQTDAPYKPQDMLFHIFPCRDLCAECDADLGAERRAGFNGASAVAVLFGEWIVRRM